MSTLHAIAPPLPHIISMSQLFPRTASIESSRTDNYYSERYIQFRKAPQQDAHSVQTLRLVESIPSGWLDALGLGSVWA